MRLGSLCSGAGMLDLAVSSLMPTEPVWHAETDQAASQVLAHRWPGVPNLGDITTTDWSAVEPVDVLAGGIPCQSWSLAGKRKGSADERDLWPIHKTGRRGAYHAIREMRPKVFVLENVASLVSAENGDPFGQILADLDDLGYVASWTTVGACRVGACHHRHRLFLAAVRAELVADTVRPPSGPSLWRTPYGRWQPSAGLLFGDASPVSWPQAGITVEGHAWQLPADVCGATSPVLPTPTARDGLSGPGHAISAQGSPDLRTAVSLLPTPTARDATRGAGWGDQPGRPLSEAIALLPTPRASDAAKGGPNQRGSSGDLALPAAVQPGRFGVYEAAVRRQERAFGIPAPEPTEPGRNGRPRLAAPFAEWMLGLPRGWITDVAGRGEAIHIAGNGVVVPQAVYALPTLPTFRSAAALFGARAFAVAGGGRRGE